MRWWELGNAIYGQEVVAKDISCPYCGQEGRCERLNRQERMAAGGHGPLYAEIWRCSLCANHSFVMWRRVPVSSSTDPNWYAFSQEPQPRPDPKTIKAPPGWPAMAQTAYAEARRSIATDSWNAAATMARRCAQAAIRELGGTGRSLHDEINNLRTQGRITGDLAEWAQHVRILGNPGAHPDPDEGDVTEADAREAVEFADYLCHYLFTMPAKIQAARARRTGTPPTP